MKILDFNKNGRDKWVAEQVLKIPAGAQVLDVGVGTGPYRTLFSHCEYKTHDFAQEPDTIGKYTSLDYVSDITSIPVSSDSFDVVLCTEVLEHVPDPQLAVNEMARILKKGGVLLLSAPLGSFLHQEPYHYYGGFTPYWYQKFLSEAGFEIRTIDTNRGFFSWFGQESQRFSALIDPRRTLKTKWRWPLLTLLWLITLPFFRILFPLLGAAMDSLKLEHSATIGYHVVAVKHS